MTKLSLSRISLALLAGALACAAHAQETPAPVQDEGAPPKAVKVTARRNPNDLPYDFYFRDQARLYSYLPARPRMVDVVWRVSFTELSEPEQDAYVPQGWAVALIGNGYEQTVPVARGGYFLLPALPLGRQGAAIMFKEQSMSLALRVSWVVHVGAGQRLSYADFGRAMDEVHSAQSAMPPGYMPAANVRAIQYDGLKACFLDAGGALLIDGKPAADARVGNCSVLKFDPARAGGGQEIEFSGPLDIVTVVATKDYRKDSA